MGRRADFYDRYTGRVESLQASERARLLEEAKSGKVVAFGRDCYVIRLQPTLVDLAGESCRELTQAAAILFKGWQLNSAELPLAAKRVFVHLFKKGSNCGGIVVPAAGMDRHGLRPQISRSKFLVAPIPAKWGRQQELADATSQAIAPQTQNPQRGKRRRVDKPPETPTSAPPASEWPASSERLAAETLVGVGQGIVPHLGSPLAAAPNSEVLHLKQASDRARGHIQQATAAAIQEMQRWFCGQIQRLATERDTYKALAEEREQQLQTWERTLRLMPTRNPTV